MSGIDEHHLMVCDALGLDHSWYEVPIAHKNVEQAPTP
jgi:hypothetical protein